MSFRFAIPGDLSTPTGGYVYDARLLAEGGMRHVPLPGGFPAPSESELAETAAALSVDAPTLIDGLAYGALPADLIRSLPRAPVALCHHPLGKETGLDAYEAALLLKREAEALDLAAHVIVTSDETKRTLVAELGQAEERVTVAPPGLARVDPITRGDTGEPTILTVASMTPRKGHDVLIAALHRLRDQPWTARWVGPLDRDPEHFEAIREAIAEAGLAARIRLEGALSGPALEEAYAEADIFCLPSRYEGYGMVFAEAMMRGLPIVACNAGAVSDLVPPRAGYLTPIDDPAALAEALEIYLDDAAFRAVSGAAGRAEAMKIPGWDATLATVRAVMERA